MIGTAYLDDSADPSGKEVFLAAGFYCPDGGEWRWLRRQWRKVLKPRNIPYYRTYDWRTLTGGFAPLKEKWGEEKARKIAEMVRDELHDVIENSRVIAGFGMGIRLEDFREVDAMPEARQSKRWMRDSHDYQTAAFRHVFCKITHTLCVEADPTGLVGFVCDDSTHYKKIRRGYERVRQKFPDLGAKMTSLKPMDDKQVPELQMADLMADVSRQVIQKYIAAADGKQVRPGAISSKVLSVDLWTKLGMLGSICGTMPGA